MKFKDVGSSNGLTGFETGPWPTAEVRETGKNVEGEVSVYCCDGCACAMDRFRAGDTPELLTWGMLPDEASPHAGRLGLHSVSELATREPEPVLPSGRSAVAPARALFSLGRELSRAVEPKPKPMGLLFHMFFPHGDECEERSVSAPLSEIPFVKSRDRVLLAMAAIVRVCGETRRRVRAHGTGVTVLGYGD